MISDPQFIVIGAHKCGTSWLFNCLYEHPEILLKDKIDYFYAARKKGYGLDWYQNQFKIKNTFKKIKGELSTVYFFSENSAKAIYDHNPNIKLIVTLRNPIERSYSHYLQEIKMGAISKDTSFEAAIYQVPNLLNWGHYKQHYEAYARLFKQEQIHLILFDDIQTNSKTVIKALYSFLNVNPGFRPKSVNKKINQARIPKYIRLDFFKRKFSDIIRKTALGEKLWWRLRHTWMSKIYYNLNSAKMSEYRGISATTRNQLSDYFKDDIDFILEKINRPDINWH